MNGEGARHGAPDANPNAINVTVPQTQDEVALVDLRIEVHGGSRQQVLARINALVAELRETPVQGVVYRYTTLRHPHPMQRTRPTVFFERRRAA